MGRLVLRAKERLIKIVMGRKLNNSVIPLKKIDVKRSDENELKKNR